MRNLTHVSLAFLFGAIGAVTSGCGSAGGAETTQTAPGGGASTEVTLAEKSGAGFTCFILPRESGVGEVLYCSGVNVSLGLSAVTPIPYVETDTTFSSFEVWDDTVCVVTSVAERPLSRNAGSALYCFGEASLGFNYVSYDLVYSGPVFSTAAHGSVGLTYHTEPFVGGEESMDLMMNVGGMWLVMIDGVASVSAGTQDCTSNEGTLTCNSFTLTLE